MKSSFVSAAGERKWTAALAAVLAWQVAAGLAARADEPSPGARAAEPKIVRLWPGRAPDEIGGIGPERERMSPRLERVQVEVTEPTRLLTDVTEPTITIQAPPPGKGNGAAVIICPGGGYWNLYWELEGEEVAAWINSIGATAVLLKYRVPRRAGEPEAEPALRPLQDAQRAVSLVRSRAAEWGVDPARIGIVGFSAGGHLAMATATTFERRSYATVDLADEASCRPDFAIAVYPGYLKSKDRDELAAGLSVPTSTPPVFLVHGDEDIVSRPEHSVLFYLALRKANIPAELHVFAGTTHDFGVRKSDRTYSSWTELCARWLAARGFLPEPSKVAPPSQPVQPPQSPKSPQSPQPSQPPQRTYQLEPPQSPRPPQPPQRPQPPQLPGKPSG